MHPKAPVAIAIALLAGCSNAAPGALEERATCLATNPLLKLMLFLPTYAAPFCKSGVNLSPVTPLVTVTNTPTVTIIATLTTVKTVTAPGTATVVVTKRGLDERSPEALQDRAVLKDRALLDFAAFAQLAGLNLAATSVSTACSCFVSSYTAPTATTTQTGPNTVTVAIAKATVAITTTVKATTVTSTNPAATIKPSTAAASSATLIFVSSISQAPSSAAIVTSASASASVISSASLVGSSFVPLTTITNPAEASSLSALVSSALGGTLTTASAVSMSASADVSISANSTGTGSAALPTATAVDPASSTTCGAGLQAYNASLSAAPSTYNGCNPDSATGFSACFKTIGGADVCDSCGKCATTVCTKDTDCATGSACIVDSACGAAVCLQTLDTCYL